MDEFPRGIDLFVAFLAFLAGWVYAIATYGLFLGGGLGWIPAAFIAIFAMFIWRFVFLLVLIAAAGIATWIYLAK